MPFYWPPYLSLFCEVESWEEGKKIRSNVEGFGVEEE